MRMRIEPFNLSENPLNVDLPGLVEVYGYRVVSKPGIDRNQCQSQEIYRSQGSHVQHLIRPDDACFFRRAPVVQQLEVR